MAVQARPADEVRYPESDGVPVGETETHYDAIMDLVHQLRVHFRREQPVHVSANQFWYFEEGNPRSVVCPDVYVVFGVPQVPPRDIWKTWEDHCFPSVIFEFTSRKTRRIDTGFKPGLYEKLGADELWLFDPLGDYLEPRFQGWRRDAGRFVRVDPDPTGPSFDGPSRRTPAPARHPRRRTVNQVTRLRIDPRTPGPTSRPHRGHRHRTPRPGT